MERAILETAMESYGDGTVIVRRVESKGNGLGVVADRTLMPGVEIGDYIGELLGSASVRVRKNDGSFRFEIGDDTGLYVDPHDDNGRVKYVSVAHYINEPSPGETCNCAFFADSISSRMYIRTVCAIEPGQELLATYGVHYAREYPVNEEECSKAWDHWDSLLRDNLQKAKDSGMQVEDADALLGPPVKLGPEGRDLSTKPPETTDDGEPLCALCGGEANAFSGPISNYGRSNVHFKCALWSSEVFYHEGDRSTLVNVEKAVARGRRLPCTWCDQKGSTVGCNEPKCRESFHFKCAGESGAEFDHEQLAVYCKAHRRSAEEKSKEKEKAKDKSLKLSSELQGHVGSGRLITLLWAISGMKGTELQKQCRLWAAVNHKIPMSSEGKVLKREVLQTRLMVRVVLALWEANMLAAPQQGGPNFHKSQTPGSFSIGEEQRVRGDRLLQVSAIIGGTNRFAVVCGIAQRLSDFPKGGKRKRQLESEEDEYVVETILDKRVNADTRSFEWKVKWLGYDGKWDEFTWEPIENLISCQQQLADFEAKLTKEQQDDLNKSLNAQIFDNNGSCSPKQS